MYQITEFSLHKNTITSDRIVLVVKKNNKSYCWNMENLSELVATIEYLSHSDCGWLLDSDVGELIAHYTIKDYPELFI